MAHNEHTTDNGPSDALAQLLHGVCAVHDVTVVTTETGARFQSISDEEVPYNELEPMVRETADPREVIGQLYRHLAVHSMVASLGDGAEATLRNRARIVALPPGHCAHLGPEWVQDSVPGAVLDRGLGLVGLFGVVDETVPLPPSALKLLTGDPATLWQEAASHAEDMAQLAFARLHRDTLSVKEPVAALRSTGGVDALSLLSTKRIRTGLARSSQGMRAVAAPARNRVWVDLTCIDPAFVASAWQAQNPIDAGVDQALLVTAEEVCTSKSVPDPQKILQLTEIDLRSFDEGAAANNPWLNYRRW